MVAAKKLDNVSVPERFAGITRNYSQADVDRLRGSVRIEYTLAKIGAERLWELLHTESYVHALGAMTGGQAMQMVKAGLKAIYISGWQVAADANDSGHVYPDQSLYPLSRALRADAREAHQQRSSARRSDRSR
jgi:isocitrate lyase